MRKLLLLLVFTSALCAGAQTCNYAPGGNSVVSGCPASWSAISGITQGSTTPTAIPNTGGTFNGVTTASIDVIWGIPYNSPTCGYSSPIVAQSSCDITWVFPHEAGPTLGSTANYQIIWCFHEGGGSGGGTDVSSCFGVGNIATEPILEVQRFLGIPNRVGHTGIVLALVNYRLTNFSAIPSGPNLYATQWQDAKCSLWYTLANASTFPGNKNLISFYGPSWGAVMVWWVVMTPDNQYTSTCNTAAPGTDPQYVAVMSWNPTVWMYPFGNALWDNGNAQALHAMQGQLNTTVEATAQSTCAGFSPTCDPNNNISSSYLSTYKNVTFMSQTGTCGLDLTVPPCWGSGATQGGESYQTAASLSALGLHPYFEQLPNCVHVCDIGAITSASQTDAFAFLLGYANSGGNTGGTTGN